MSTVTYYTMTILVSYFFLVSGIITSDWYAEKKNFISGFHS